MKRNIPLFALALSVLLLGGCAQDSGQTEYIGTESAKTLALQAAGFTSDQASFSNANISSRNGTDYYEVSFSAGGKDYRYDIDAVTGTVIESKNSTPMLTLEEAKSKALTHAGLKASDVKFAECKLDEDDGKAVYDIEFYSESKEYDYEVDACTGDILDVDHDAERYTPDPKPDSVPDSAPDPKPASGTNTAITADEAKKLALAQVPGATTKDIREFESDYDDGRLEYEGKIVYKETEYEFEIDGHSGAIRNWEVESVYD